MKKREIGSQKAWKLRLLFFLCVFEDSLDRSFGEDFRIDLFPQSSFEKLRVSAISVWKKRRENQFTSLINLWFLGAVDDFIDYLVKIAGF